MASEDSYQPSSSWDFTTAHHLLAAFNRPSTPPRAHELSRTPPSPSPSPLYKAHLYDPKSSKPSGLGDLNRLFDFLGIPHDNSSGSHDETTDSPSSSASDKSTPPSSLPDGPSIEDFISESKEVRWTDQVAGNQIAEYGRSACSTNLGPELSLQSTLDDSDIEDSTPSRNTRSRRKSRARRVQSLDPSEFESEPEYQRTVRQHSVHEIRMQQGSDGEDTSLLDTNATLIPSSVTPNERPRPRHALWVPPPLPNTPLNRNEIQPIYTLTKEEKYDKLVKKLQKRFGKESTAISRMTLDEAMRERGNDINADGIHIFIDCSNIVIGFLDELKRKRGINVKSPAKGGVISWHKLALILERGRPVARRILAGSHGSPLDTKQPKRPGYLTDAEKCGYELNILDRVIKTKDSTPYKKKRGNGNGYATASGYSSGSDGTYMRQAVAEQGVDEILHMKLLESLIDTAEPSTIVLASGDAAEAEYSGGFLKNVERALKLGWKVEVVAWSANLSKDYQTNTFLGRWRGRFSIILLDDFSEELLAMYAPKWPEKSLA